jgi:hypothetical protein
MGWDRAKGGQAMNSLTEQDCKALTGFLGECWHEIIDIKIHEVYGKLHKCSCGAIDCEKSALQRTFTTPNDMVALKEKLVEKGLWSEFLIFAAKIYNDENKDEERELDLTGGYVVIDFIHWLISPPWFTKLVAKFLKEKSC